MSWSVSTRGSVAEVRAELERQFSYPLADAPAGLPDEGERETVRRIRDTISQCLETFGPDKQVTVSANGHMGFDNWDSRAGAYQQVNVSIQPGVS
jgi:hypothetical protein